MCASRRECTKPEGSMKVKVDSITNEKTKARSSALNALAHRWPVSMSPIEDDAEQERTRWDPKDGELCLNRTKPDENLVEVRSESDVQIDRQI